MPDFHKTIRQDVDQETPDKFLGRNAHSLPSVNVPVIPPFESNHAIFHTDDPVVGDGDTVGISAKILHNAGGILERRFAIDYPLFKIYWGVLIK